MDCSVETVDEVVTFPVLRPREEVVLRFAAEDFALLEDVVFRPDEEVFRPDEPERLRAGG